MQSLRHLDIEGIVSSLGFDMPRVLSDAPSRSCDLASSRSLPIDPFVKEIEPAAVAR